MSDQAPPSEHDQLAHLVEVEIPALEAALAVVERERDTLRAALLHIDAVAELEPTHCAPKIRRAVRKALAAVSPKGEA